MLPPTRVANLLPPACQDHFVTTYSKLLADRLLQRSSFTYALEALAVSQLARVVPADRTSKLQRMLTDARVSAQLDDTFMYDEASSR